MSANFSPSASRLWMFASRFERLHMYSHSYNAGRQIPKVRQSDAADIRHVIAASAAQALCRTNCDFVIVFSPFQRTTGSEFSTWIFFCRICEPAALYRDRILQLAFDQIARLRQTPQRLVNLLSARIGACVAGPSDRLEICLDTHRRCSGFLWQECLPSLGRAAEIGQDAERAST